MSNSDTVSCPHCRSELASHPSLAGKLVACPVCGQQFQMPLPAPSCLPPPLPPLVSSRTEQIATTQQQVRTGTQPLNRRSWRSWISKHPAIRVASAVAATAAIAIVGFYVLGGTNGLPGFSKDYERIIAEFLRENANDIEELEIVRIDKPVPLESGYTWRGSWEHEVARNWDFRKTILWEQIEIPGRAVVVKYRDATPLGGMRLGASRGTCVRWCSTNRNRRLHDVLGDGRPGT